ncbi:putative ribosome-binding factor A, mitochondrial [Latimeria chalumnae]|uniref:putative ribosome-binding factor A, mitochondrial n=1 Tax=Latimeria chalumnae TaxID=7897 RepID=UPI00313E3633
MLPGFRIPLSGLYKPLTDSRICFSSGISKGRKICLPILEGECRRLAEASSSRGRKPTDSFPAAHPATGALLTGCGSRNLHTACTLCGSKNLLKKFASKTKKKFWYPSPTLGSQLMYKPAGLQSISKGTPYKTKREDSVRIRALNCILYKAFTDLMSTCEVSEEIFDLKIEITKVSLAGDFSACRVYWQVDDATKQVDHIQQILQRNAPRVRHLLTTHQVVGGIPPIVFVKDKQYALISEVERLLEIADFGPPEESEELKESQVHLREPSSLLKETSEEPPATSDELLSLSVQSSMFGIDHESLNRQIMAYKRRTKTKGLEADRLKLTQQEQLEELRKLKRNKKKSLKLRLLDDDDITPKKYLLQKYMNEESALDSSLSAQRNRLEDELKEATKELEEEEEDQEVNTFSLESGEKKTGRHMPVK